MTPKKGQPGYLPPHGTATRRSNHKCECEPCKQAAYRYDKAVSLGYKMKVPAFPSARRLQALACLGWGLHHLHDYTGLSHASLGCIRLERHDNIFRSAAKTIGEAYDELSDTWGPALNRTIYIARRNGWAPPIAWETDLDNPMGRPSDWDIAPYLARVGTGPGLSRRRAS